MQRGLLWKKWSYKVVLCNVCLPGYSKGVIGICEICETTNNIPMETILFFAIVMGVIITVVVIIASVRYFKRPKKEANKISGLERISQLRERARTASNVDSDSSALLDFQQDKSNWFNRGRTKVKILLSFYQIVGQFESISPPSLKSLHEGYLCLQILTL